MIFETCTRATLKSNRGYPLIARSYQSLLAELKIPYSPMKVSYSFKSDIILYWHAQIKWEQKMTKLSGTPTQEAIF
jgi:hypothetical protein